MTRSRSRLSTAAGTLVLSLGLLVRLWANGNVAHFASGFLLGVSVALLILGLAGAPRRASK